MVTERPGTNGAGFTDGFHRGTVKSISEKISLAALRSGSVSVVLQSCMLSIINHYSWRE